MVRKIKFIHKKTSFNYQFTIIFCSVPEAPTAVKALVMSADSILISWKPPTEPNGIVEYYLVYQKQIDADGGSGKPEKSQKIVPNLKKQNLSYQVKNLDSNAKYEFWVTASTTIGEGQPSKSVSVSPSASGKFFIFVIFFTVCTFFNL